MLSENFPRMLSQKLQTIFEEDTISIERINQIFNDDSIGLILALLSLPSALPVPAPGYSVPFGLAIGFIGLQIIWGRHTLWLPTAWQQKSVQLTPYKKTAERVLTFVNFFEKYIKTRSTRFFQRGYRIFGVIIFLCGISMIIPFPMTNTIPAMATFVFGLSLLEDDGLAAIGACFIGLVGISITTTIVVFGSQAVLWLSRFW